MAQDMREDSEVVLQAVSQHGLALQFAEARRSWGKHGKKNMKHWPGVGNCPILGILDITL